MEVPTESLDKSLLEFNTPVLHQKLMHRVSKVQLTVHRSTEVRMLIGVERCDTKDS